MPGNRDSTLKQRGSDHQHRIARWSKTSEDAREMLRFDLDHENDTIRNDRDRVRQCEALGEFAMAGQIREILVDEQDHPIDLATALDD